MKPTVYVETSVISYLTGRISRDLIVAGHQQITREWWEMASARYRLLVSEAVMYLVTWNCRHIANGATIWRLRELNNGMNRPTPVIVTPEALLE